MKLADVSGRRWVTCDLPAGMVATPLRENAATPATLSAAKCPRPTFCRNMPAKVGQTLAAYWVYFTLGL
jgi:hypothetical protein